LIIARIATVFGLMPSYRLNCARKACDRVRREDGAADVVHPH
jgi:hypothetical protein